MRKLKADGRAIIFITQARRGTLGLRRGRGAARRQVSGPHAGRGRDAPGPRAHDGRPHARGAAAARQPRAGAGAACRAQPERTRFRGSGAVRGCELQPARRRGPRARRHRRQRPTGICATCWPVCFRRSPARSCSRHRCDRLEFEDAPTAGLAYIPADRSGTSLVQSMSIADNLALRDVARLPLPLGWLDAAGARATWSSSAPDSSACAWREAMPAIGTLSGGNQQKVVLAREIGREPGVLIAFQPTWGLDPARRASSSIPSSHCVTAAPCSTSRRSSTRCSASATGSA